jgi:hypothetical protein
MSERESVGGGANVDPFGGLLLDPSNELRFKGPFDDYVTVSLTIKNPTDKRIAFKIKTTAPKRYCVKPNSGVLDQGQSMKVNVLLQPFNYDPSEKNKHKFMVQYLYLNDAEMQLSVDAILNKWKDFPASRLLDLKLKCLFEFTEAEQLKLSQLQPVNDSTVIPPQKNDRTQSSTAKNDTQQQQQHSSSTSSQQPTKTPSTSSRSSDIYSTANSDSQQTSSSTNDFDSNIKTSNYTTGSTNPNINNNNNSPYNNNNSSSISSNARPEKNDNTINELKLVKQENEFFKKEINRLKEEEARLRKIALQPSSSASSSSFVSKSNSGGSLELADLLSNRLVLIIIVLIAIIIYLIMFR